MGRPDRAMMFRSQFRLKYRKKGIYFCVQSNTSGDSPDLKLTGGNLSTGQAEGGGVEIGQS